ncbi:peptidoglycan/LPS O-acetylase OafA/YrhL [Bradyrhizobium sp. JR4.1]
MRIARSAFGWPRGDWPTNIVYHRDGDEYLTDKQAGPISIQYRPDVDGLRAIAVLLVLLFHCGFESFAGGFIGVDVFFVISGFLITSLILADLQKGTFSFFRFYTRRIRRLLPAMLVTVLISLVGAALVMAPEHLADTAKSGALATISLCNFYFAMVASYFDSSAQSKPFLHIWSLSVEEQFYLFWPVLLVLLYRGKRSWAVAALVAAGIPLGLAISQYWITKNPTHAYFLLPFRSFQFLMGAACVWLSHVATRNKVLGQAIGIAGLILILVPAIAFSDKTPFPGIAAAVPSLGAMLVIWQGRQFVLNGVLANPVMVWFGRISYSTYLAHWPIIVFWLYLAIEPLSLVHKVLLFLLSVAAGQLLDSMVAQRFRYVRPGQGKRWLFPATQVGLLALIGVGSWSMVATGGLPARFALAPEASTYRNESVFPFLRDYGDGIVHVGRTGSSPRVLIFGDSMVQNYVPAILGLEGMRNADVDIVSRGGCVLAMDAVLIKYGSPDRVCLKLRDHLYELKDRYDLVVWSQNWLGYDNSLHWETAGQDPARAFPGSVGFGGWRDGIERTVNHFESLAKKVVVIGPAVTVEVNPIIQRIGPLTDVSAVEAQLDQMKDVSTEGRESLEKSIRALVTAKANTLYIDPRTIFCADRLCHLSDGKFSYFLDSLHNTSAAIPTLRSGLERAGFRSVFERSAASRCAPGASSRAIDGELRMRELPTYPPCPHGERRLNAQTRSGGK